MTILTLALLFFVQLGFLKQLLKQGRLFESCIIFCIPFLIFFCKKHNNSKLGIWFQKMVWIRKKKESELPLKRVKESILGSSGPGIDSNPENPDSIPAWAIINHDHQKNHFIRLNVIIIMLLSVPNKCP